MGHALNRGFGKIMLMVHSNKNVFFIPRVDVVCCLGNSRPKCTQRTPHSADVTGQCGDEIADLCFVIRFDV